MRRVALFFLVFGAAPTAVAQDPPNGYAVISSVDTLYGVRGCYAACEDAAGCGERERCVEVPDVGALCMRRRAETPAPEGWSVCPAEHDNCGAASVCARKPAPTKIDAFIAHKRARGFDVHLIDDTTWGGGEGDQAADNLRAWLQANYEALDLRYVLLIGDPRLEGDLPMRRTRPANNAHQDWARNPQVPTDFYFAELTGDWDLDGDGQLGEFNGLDADVNPDHGGDFGPGGVERDAELSIGRIPFYGRVADLDHILQKSIDYEETPAEEIGWRRSALLAAEANHRAFFGEQIRSEILVPNDFESYRIYDVEECWDHEANDDVGCRSPIDGVPEHLTCSSANVSTGINAFTPGLVTWLTHGSGRGAGAVMNIPGARELPDDRPFFTFQASCWNSQPSVTENISYVLLINGAIGTVGATVISHGPGSPTDLRQDAGNAGMAYAFAERLVGEGMSAGEALTDLRRDVDVRNRWWYWKNYLAFNLWGDPSLGLGSHALDAPPDPPDAGPSPDVGAPEPDAAVADPDGAPVEADAGPVEADAGPDEIDAEVDATAADQGEIPEASGDSAGGCSVAHPSSGGGLLLLCLLFGLRARGRR